MEKVKLLAVAFLAFAGCQSSSSLGQSVRGAIVPHHTLVEHEMEAFYSEIADPEARHVILISPNHYGFGFNYVQTDEVRGPAADILVNQGVLIPESEDFDQEHGIYVHMPFLEKYFPKAEVIPITVKVGTPQSVLDELIDGLTTYADSDGTYVIASIDFSHYVTEEIALMNDERTKTWLMDWEERPSEFSLADLAEVQSPIVAYNDDSIAIDSIESLYVLLKLMERSGGRDFDFWKRTSTTTVLEMNDPDFNTSHIFAKFLIQD